MEYNKKIINWDNRRINMDFGYIRCASATINTQVADCTHNTEEIISAIKGAYENSTEVITFQELAITGYTCGDLFSQQALIEQALIGLNKILCETANIPMVIVVGLPVSFNGKLYNCGAVLYKGRILGCVPKTYLPNYNEFYEKRWFTPAPKGIRNIKLLGQTVPFGTNIIFRAENNCDLAIALEICEDLWTAIPPSSYHANAGATLICNLSAGNEIIGKADYRRGLVTGQSARLICGYVYTCAGQGESTTDVVFSGHNIISEYGNILAESKRFTNSVVYGDVDLMRISCERRKNTSFTTNDSDYLNVYFELEKNNAVLNRFIDPQPFVPADEKRREERCKEIMDIQALGLVKRLSHIGTKNVVIGISGGLDSTLALIVTARAFDMAGLDKKGIITVTMPCFGTTERTHNNAVRLCRALGTEFMEVNIKQAVKQHFTDIGHSEELKDLTYENSQARERTQVLMDIASRYNGFVVGTGDLSELALGWATYNGDHMSMYGVNCSIPKTLIKYLVKYVADYTDNALLKEALLDVLDTPVSPELLPPDEGGNIAQITEDLVGPYELHDFFLYNMMRLSYPPEKIYYLAKLVFKGVYEDEFILKWLKRFYWRFFSQQFKRSALPDGPKVGSVSLSPRGDWRMPSDAVAKDWINRLENL